MIENSSPDNHGIVPYQPSTELVRRGLEDLALALRAIGRSLYVPNEYATVQDALAHAQAGDTIEVSTGTYAENVMIDKAVTIRGQGGLVVLRPARDNEPVLLVQCGYGNIVLENLSICGNTKVFNQQQVGISIAQGRAEIKRCHFERWCSLHWDIPIEERPDPDDDLEYWESYENSYALQVGGKDQEVIIEECHFFDCDEGIEIVGGSKVRVVRCEFKEIQGTALIVCNSNVVMYGNSFVRTQIIFSLGQETRIESNHDTFAMAEALVSCANANSDGTVITFSHATVLCTNLTCFVFIHPSANGEWNWMKPKLIFIDSILELKDDEPTFIFVWSAGKWGDPEGYIWDAVEFLEPNLLFIKSRPSQIDPRLGPLEEGCLTLQSDSPALNAASDGTHLGAWQGIA